MSTRQSPHVQPARTGEDTSFGPDPLHVRRAEHFKVTEKGILAQWNTDNMDYLTPIGFRHLTLQDWHTGYFPDTDRIRSDIPLLEFFKTLKSGPDFKPYRTIKVVVFTPFYTNLQFWVPRATPLSEFKIRILRKHGIRPENFTLCAAPPCTFTELDSDDASMDRYAQNANALLLMLRIRKHDVLENYINAKLMTTVRTGGLAVFGPPPMDVLGNLHMKYGVGWGTPFEVGEGFQTLGIPFES
ncbi:hypothetical protein BJ508DRAFT_419068 [Ascobolus immersus RN42]|uniref:Uncharacterized protein n=1 Tax=Ascobolus immersus RN42 TaxID=1160509 RepID=A0A3N4HUP2_ASCIM|nr:hypothetical protein BJ508DRAFT_419068 [Ascobolus immersus RN42]